MLESFQLFTAILLETYKFYNRSAITSLLLQCPSSIYPGNFWVEKGGNMLLCKFCHNRPIDHIRVKSIKTHLTSDKHRDNKRLAQEWQTREQVNHLQPALTFSAKETRDQIITDFVAAIAIADIPFYPCGQTVAIHAEAFWDTGGVGQETNLHVHWDILYYESRCVNNLRESIKNDVCMYAPIVNDWKNDWKENVLTTLKEIPRVCVIFFS